MLHSAGRAGNGVAGHRRRTLLVRRLPHHTTQHVCRRHTYGDAHTLNARQPQYYIYGHGTRTAGLRHTKRTLRAACRTLAQGHSCPDSASGTALDGKRDGTVQLLSRRHRHTSGEPTAPERLLIALHPSRTACRNNRRTGSALAWRQRAPHADRQRTAAARQRSRPRPWHQ